MPDLIIWTQTKYPFSGANAVCTHKHRVWYDFNFGVPILHSEECTIEKNWRVITIDWKIKGTGFNIMSYYKCAVLYYFSLLSLCVPLTLEESDLKRKDNRWEFLLNKGTRDKQRKDNQVKTNPFEILVGTTSLRDCSEHRRGQKDNPVPWQICYLEDIIQNDSMLHANCSNEQHI